MVAESTEILRPITQLGWAQASSGVTWRSVAGSRVRNGPAGRGEDDLLDPRVPGGRVFRQRLEDRRMLAVDRQQRRAALLHRRAGTGRRRPPGLPCWPAAAACRRARRPGTRPGPQRRRWPPSRCRPTHARRLLPAQAGPTAPRSARPLAEPCAPAARPGAALAMTANCGLNCAHCCSIRSTWVAALSANTSKRSGWRAITSSVLAPTEPVEPRTVMRCFIRMRQGGQHHGQGQGGQQRVHPIEHAAMARAAGGWSP